ncbi:MAG: 30S ribosomal protein S6 [Deltaproteobacteria bacterium]
MPRLPRSSPRLGPTRPGGKMATAAAAPATRWAREYETIYILRSDVDNAVAEKVVDRAKDVIARLDGTLTKLDNWGKRKLAYPIRKSNRGIFVYLKYVGYSDLVAELERNLRFSTKWCGSRPCYSPRTSTPPRSPSTPKRCSTCTSRKRKPP